MYFAMLIRCANLNGVLVTQQGWPVVVAAADGLIIMLMDRGSLPIVMDNSEVIKDGAIIRIEAARRFEPIDISYPFAIFIIA